MKINLSVLSIIFLFFITFTITNQSLLADKNQIYSQEFGATIYIDCDNLNGPWDGSQQYPYRYISDGLNVSTDGDTIFVCNGTYYESIEILNSIILTCEKNTIIGGNYTENIINVLSDNVLIKNFIIRNSGGYNHNSAIKLNFDNVLIKNCTICRSRIGIYALNSSNNIIDNCSFYNNELGISLALSIDNIIEGCTFAYNSIGTNFKTSSSNIIKFSYYHSNGRACFINNSKDISIYHCNISDNSANHGGIFLWSDSNVSIKNCVIQHNGVGISIFKSNQIDIINNNFSKNTLYAIWMDENCISISVNKCNIIGNLRFGIYKPFGCLCNISYNNIYGNKLYGVQAKQSHCKSQNNFWGSPMGPSYTDLGQGDRISFSLFRLNYRPWLRKPIENIGANWNYNEEYMNKTCEDLTKKQIIFNEEDSDKDGVPNWWEIKWGYNPYSWDNHTYIDTDGDGLVNIEECYTDSYFSNPFKKDIFLEIDWIETKTKISNKPNEKLISEIVEIFEDHNISLHIDIGNLDGGEEIPYISNFSFTKLNELYWDYFLHNDMNNPRKGIFHYGIICDIGPDVNFPYVGWNRFDAFLISVELLKQKLPLVPRDKIIMYSTIHHLGHTLGLISDTYDGIDNLGTYQLFSYQWLKYLNYKSCMNYYYKFKTFSYSDGTGGYGDFNDWDNIDFTFFKESKFRQ